MTTEPACHRILAAGDDLETVLASLADGAVLGIPAGRWRGPLQLHRSVTLLGLGDVAEVVLDGDRGGPVITVQEDDLNVRLVGLSLVNGLAQSGGAVSLTGFSSVELQSCVLRDNRAGQGPGGAVYVEAGQLGLVRCRVVDNEGRGGTAALVDGVGALALQDCLVVADAPAGGAALSVRDGAEVTLTGSTIDGGAGAAVSVAGTSSRRPRLSVTGCLLSGATSLDLDAAHGGRVHVTDSLLSGLAKGIFKPMGTVAMQDALLLGEAPEPYRPAPDSPARGLVTAGAGLDLNSVPRPLRGATAGALE